MTTNPIISETTIEGGVVQERCEKLREVRKEGKATFFCGRIKLDTYLGRPIPHADCTEHNPNCGMASEGGPNRISRSWKPVSKS